MSNSYKFRQITFALLLSSFTVSTSGVFVADIPTLKSMDLVKQIKSISFSYDNKEQAIEKIKALILKLEVELDQIPDQIHIEEKSDKDCDEIRRQIKKLPNLSPLLAQYQLFNIIEHLTNQIEALNIGMKVINGQ